MRETRREEKTRKHRDALYPKRERAQGQARMEAEAEATTQNSGSRPPSSDSAPSRVDAALPYRRRSAVAVAAAVVVALSAKTAGIVALWPSEAGPHICRCRSCRHRDRSRLRHGSLAEAHPGQSHRIRRCETTRRISSTCCRASQGLSA